MGKGDPNESNSTAGLLELNTASGEVTDDMLQHLGFVTDAYVKHQTTNVIYKIKEIKANKIMLAWKGEGEHSIDSKNDDEEEEEEEAAIDEEDGDMQEEERRTLLHNYSVYEPARREVSVVCIILLYTFSKR